MRTVTVSSYSELQEALFEDSWNGKIKRHRSNQAFRGLPSRNYELKSSLSRACPGNTHLEANLLRNFVKYADPDSIRYKNFWDLLSIAQHHGLPTRLLDWTYSPYVAMHFVTERMDQAHEDGAIWCVDFVKTHKLLPKNLKEQLEAVDANVFTTDMLNESIGSLKDLDALGKRDCLLFFEPPSLNSRIINQFALFSIQPDAEATVDAWIAQHPNLCKQVVIPASLKWEVRDKLDQANINERVLYPGLDGLCRWLARNYLPMP